MGDNKDLISIIIPTYKRPEMLERAIKSVFSQTYDRIEILVIDDNEPGSLWRKKTNKIMKKYKKNKNILYIKHKQNKGGATARNTGIKNSNGNYIAFLDDDDVWLPNKLELQIDRFHDSKYKDELGIVYCGIKYIDENNNIIVNNKEIRKLQGDVVKEHLIKGEITTSTVLIQREAIEKVNGFRELYSEQEYDLILRILLEGYKIDYVDKKLLIMHMHNQERISNSKNKIHGLEYMYNYKKQFFYLLNNNQINKLKKNHYSKVFYNILKLEGRISALKFITKTNKDIFDLKDLSTFFITIIFGFEISLNIKRIFHKFQKYMKHYN